ncbi:MAG: hypothetical protein U0234_25940 [Sandaracinus sp.]
MRRTFRHEAQGRTWWIEVEGPSLRIGAASDAEPDDAFERARKLASPAAATKEADALVREQEAEGFVEVGAAAAPPLDAEAYFDGLAQSWRARAPEVDAARWRATVAGLAAPWRERLARELATLHAVKLPWPEQREQETWLRMQVAASPDAFLLALRDPRAWRFALEVLEGKTTPSGYVPLASAHDLERALLSLITAPPAPAFDGDAPAPAHVVTLFRHPFGDASLTRLAELARSGDALAASNAALLLARYPALARDDVRDALAAWSARVDLEGVALRSVVLEHAVAELGTALLGEGKRPRTHAELDALLARARRGR